jgi:branched-chain amino acid transport system ATP-binding protein
VLNLRRFFAKAQRDEATEVPVPGAILAVSNLGARYGASIVLRGIDLHVMPGEIVTLLGANGAGKTTFLHTVMGLVTRTSGRVFYEGRDITHRSTESRVTGGVALCPEGRRIFAKMTVEENLRLGAGLKFQAQFGDNRAWVFELFPVLQRLRNTHAGLLSGGEQQQLAVARALMSRPKLLLLDEPSLGLAPRVIDEVYALLTTLRLRGITLVLVEESSTRALELASRAIVLKNGRVQLQGATAEVRADPRLASAYLGDSGRGGVPGDG